MDGGKRNLSILKIAGSILSTVAVDKATPDYPQAKFLLMGEDPPIPLFRAIYH